ncbi:vacuolar protein sorting-associated protein 54 [Marchantia polymorpha subsp. ruderalis]|uniref:Vacuolar protein sorting-associated protein 54 C-terminal domain-containing protein n=2 Tax=Marchantia polymorpha TaxID=3197 RepID=A0AAF6BGL7_MARPO|nr:hypothetical protein MARPO_0095s0011 [Marchantia polymorpha]BBN11151.1 hypothetical protein Mp_5g09490 [Marchantia polymorpha subsp. ruderalis]|eukprot:PTQ32747.1 hypothetical protein MARPO_0095s0011 [Marchantia polymorpha]
MDSPSSTGRHGADVYGNPSKRSSDAASSSGGGSSNRSFSLQARQSLSGEVNTAGQESDTSAYGQSLASVLNNPRLGKAGIYSADASWGSWLFQGSVDPLFDAAPPPLASGTLPEVSRADFQPYLDSIGESYGRYVAVRDHSSREQNDQPSSGSGDISLEFEGRVGQGEGLVACLREIPSLYFDEDFALDKGSTFQQACPFSSIPQNMMLQEKLSHYLDLVEVHLVKEISARSDSFFEALRQLEDLNGRIVQACDQIRVLQGTVQLLDGDLVESASRIQTLGMRRDNLLALHQQLKLVAYVNQALSALRLLVSAADCAGALDVIDDLQHLLEGDELVGLHCFRRLGDQLTSAMDSVNSTLAADFVRAGIHDTGDLESNAVVTIFHARVKDYPGSVMDMIPVEGKGDEDEESGLRDQLLPMVIGLLRTSKLPAVLRVYRDTLITDIKAAIKTVVAELLPILFTRPPEGDLPSADRQTDMEVGGLSLAYKLRALSAENFVQLLIAVFGTVQARMVRAAEVRSVVEQIIGGLQGSYAAAAVAAAFASGAAAAAAAEAAQEGQQGPYPTGSKALPSTSNLIISKGTTGASSSISRQFRADVLRENTEAVCAACDAAHGRWAKLLGVRALIHPKLRLQEFVSIYNVTQDFITATEKVGGRLGYSIRGTLQSQSKSFVDNQHSTRMAKITAVLEQETWVSIDAPDEFQVIVDSFTAVEAVSNGSLISSDVASSDVESLKQADSSDSRPTGEEEASDAARIESQLERTASETAGDDDAANAVISVHEANGLLREESVEDSEKKTNDGQTETSRPQSDVADTGKGSSPDVRAPPQSILPGNGAVANGNKPELPVQSTVNASAEVGGDLAGKKKSRERPSIKTLQVRGVSYHSVNCGLILLKMIAEYIDISNALPTLATEVVHRVAEILKSYNQRTCQLVLGAGAMQVSGLKSITAKHLALASQTISFFYAIIPDIRRLLSVHIPEARKALLLTEIDRVGQDYRTHRDEIHSKLVQIMKERLLQHLKSVPQIGEAWNKADDNDPQPSQFARSLTKEVGVLFRVVSPILLEADTRSIFTRVVALFHSQIAEAFSRLEISTPHGKRKLYRDIQLILSCIRGLPSDDVKADGAQKPRELDEFLLQRYGIEAPQ